MGTAVRIGHFIYIQFHVRDVAVSRGKVDSLSIHLRMNGCIVGSIELHFNGGFSAALQGNDQLVSDSNGIRHCLTHVHFSLPDSLHFICHFRDVLADDFRIHITPVVINLNQTVIFFHNRRFRRSGSRGFCRRGGLFRGSSGCFCRRSCGCFSRRGRGNLGRCSCGSLSRGFRRSSRRCLSRRFRRSSCGCLGRCRCRRLSRSFRGRRCRRLRGSCCGRFRRCFRGGCRRSLRRRFNRSGRHFGHFIFCIHQSHAGDQQGNSAQDGENLSELLHHIHTPLFIYLGD